MSVRVVGGFTLIELLVVIAMITILASLLVVGGGMALKQARIAGTIQRIEAVTRAFSQLGQAEGSAAFVVQDRLAAEDPALGGALTIGYPSNILVADRGTWLSYGARYDVGASRWVVADPARPYHLRFPWGQPPMVYVPDGDFDTTRDLAPFGLSQMNVECSATLLELAEVLPTDGLSAYEMERDPGAAWNDRWGNPLVVGYALYQYGPDADHTAVNEGVPPDRAAVEGLSGAARGFAGRFNWQWKRVQDFYGYTRSCYLAVGSAGPVLDDQRADAAGLWAQIDRVANRDDEGDELWRTGNGVNAMNQPPWQGIRVEKDGRRIGILSAPLEVR